MKTLRCLTALMLAALVPVAASAQEEEEEATKGFVYATYFECDVDRQWRVDEIAESVYAPIYNAAVEAGTITAWGWMAHHTGGKWRRILYHAAPSIEALLDSQDVVAEKAREKNEPATREFGKICNAHDDYIWEQLVGSGPGARGEAGFSIYLNCDMAKEERADEIVESVFAPIYNKAVSEGAIASWGWARHIVGGEWRRLATLTAPDFKTLLKARGAIIEQILAKDESEEFNVICSSHQDYMWQVQLEKP